MSLRAREFLTAWMILTRVAPPGFVFRDAAAIRRSGVETSSAFGGGDFKPAPLAATLWSWPLIGAFLGAVSGFAVVFLCRIGLPPGLASLWGIALQICLTGALHEDGLMDAADGLPGGRTVSQRLAIMRDSRVGSFGVIAGLLAILGKWVAYTDICGSTTLDAGAIVAIFAAAAGFGRLGMVWMVAMLNSARADGLASQLARGRNNLIGPTVFALGVSLFAGLNMTLVSVFGAALAVRLIASYARSKIGGYTGDVLGATSVIVEVVALTGFFMSGSMSS